MFGGIAHTYIEYLSKVAALEKSLSGVPSGKKLTDETKAELLGIDLETYRALKLEWETSQQG
jgi:hypothetical protein